MTSFKNTTLHPVQSETIVAQNQNTKRNQSEGCLRGDSESTISDLKWWTDQMTGYRHVACLKIHSTRTNLQKATDKPLFNKEIIEPTAASLLLNWYVLVC